jgi:hypothetical protein
VPRRQPAGIGHDTRRPPGPRLHDPGGTGGDAERWREAARLRAEHRSWIVIWLGTEHCFRAYRRLPGARRDTALSAATAGDLAAQITAAEQAACTPASGKERS